jgi:CRP/FNR family transcriptional regulator
VGGLRAEDDDLGPVVTVECGAAHLQALYDWRRARGMDKLSYFRKTDLFHGLTEDELKECERTLPMIEAVPGRILYTPAKEIEALYVIKEGSVRLYRLSREGREVNIGTLGAGDVFGTLPMFGAASRNTFAETASAAVLCVINESQLEGLIRRHPEIAIRLLRVLGERLVIVEDLTEDFVFRTAEQRVTRSVLKLLDERGDGKLSVSHEQIAKEAGVARETVTKVLDSMKRRGWLKIGYRSIKVLDRERLQERASD